MVAEKNVSFHSVITYINILSDVSDYKNTLQYSNVQWRKTQQQRISMVLNFAFYSHQVLYENYLRWNDKHSWEKCMF